MTISTGIPTTFDALPNGDLRFVEPDGGVFLISLYGHDLARVRWLPRGTPHPHMTRTWAIADERGERPFEGHDRHDLTALDRFGRPARQITVTDDGAVVLETDHLRIVIRRNPFRIVWSDSEGALATDNALIGYHFESARGAITHTLDRDRDREHYYGFGEKSGPLDKHGRRMRMRNTDAWGYDAETGDPLYKHIPFYITLRDTRAFGLFYDTPYDCTFDMGAEVDNYYGDYRYFRAEAGDLDYYFLYGPSLEAVVEHYTALTGRMTLPPRATLGYLGSSMGYTDAPDAQEKLRQFTELCAQHAIPCTGFHLSSGYTMSPEGRRYVFTWNRSRVPDPARMTATFHEAGMDVIANVKPALLTTHPRYDEAAPLCIRAAEADAPDLAPFWGGQGAHLDFTNPATIAWWRANLKTQLFDYGIDWAWNDNNEFNVRHDDARCHGFGRETPLAALRPVQTLLMAIASYRATVDQAPGRRPWVLSRAAMPGVQRYAATWTGDNYTSWKTLQYNIPMGLGLSLSGFASMGHDVGGFAGDAPDPELFVRWVQNGIFQPRFCIHSARGEGENAPWMYPDILPQVRALIQFRHRLIPYLYALFWEAAQMGHPIARPTVYHFPHDPACYTQSFEYLFGPFLLVASVYEPGARTRTVYLPAGTGWYDWHTGAYYSGGQTITLEAPLERFPLLAREGALIPLDVDGVRRVHVFPHRETGVGTFDLYEDDGISLNYLRGGYRLIPLRVEASPGRVALSAGASVEWVLPPGETRRIEEIEV